MDVKPVSHDSQLKERQSSIVIEPVYFDANNSNLFVVGIIQLISLGLEILIYKMKEKMIPTS